MEGTLICYANLILSVLIILERKKKDLMHILTYWTAHTKCLDSKLIVVHKDKDGDDII